MNMTANVPLTDFREGVRNLERIKPQVPLPFCLNKHDMTDP